MHTIELEIEDLNFEGESFDFHFFVDGDIYSNMSEEVWVELDNDSIENLKVYKWNESIESHEEFKEVSNDLLNVLKDHLTKLIDDSNDYIFEKVANAQKKYYDNY